MTEEFKKQIETEARQAVTELLAQAKLKKGDVFVVGCSSSEIVGGHIGKDSSLEKNTPTQEVSGEARGTDLITSSSTPSTAQFVVISGR